MQNNEKEQRFFDKIEINFNSYWENKGRYTGRIRYQNWEHEAFDFIIRPDIAERYISLIAEDVVEWAENLGKRLKSNLSEQWLLKPK